jgi:hypothetical protein
MVLGRLPPFRVLRTWFLSLEFVGFCAAWSRTVLSSIRPPATEFVQTFPCWTLCYSNFYPVVPSGFILEIGGLSAVGIIMLGLGTANSQEGEQVLAAHVPVHFGSENGLSRILRFSQLKGLSRRHQEWTFWAVGAKLPMGELSVGGTFFMSWVCCIHPPPISFLWRPPYAERRSNKVNYCR